ncbi:MAG: phosphoribosylglycinamide formyltransferase [Acidobacteria bacterium]|nr:phosphoribosylglycinamide formyltransferase [Acidobacteriota bacterium]
MTPDPFYGRRIGVLISGRGSNLQALIDAIGDGRLDARIAVVISNREDAGGLARARAAGIEAICVSHRVWPTRDDYDRALVSELKARGVVLVCLAGFMRLVGVPLIDAFPDAILNIHPSLLPAFPGVNAQRQAIEYGVAVSGVTVHLVTPALDAGPIILQRVVAVHPDDTEHTLSARILVEEHRAYPEAVKIVMDGGWQVAGRRFLRSPTGGAASPAPLPADS